MRIHLVTRHCGAIQWAEALGLPVDRLCEHLSVQDVACGDVVIGVLPLGLAAALCARGARVFALTVELPRALRGVELDADSLRRHGAQLQEFQVRAGVSGIETLALLRALRRGNVAEAGRCGDLGQAGAEREQH